MMENELPEGWVETRLDKIVEVKGGKRLPQGEPFSKEKTDYPYIRVTDFNDRGGINQDSLKYITKDVSKQIKNYTISKDDIYISIAGTIGKTGIIPSNLDGANLTENAAKIIIVDSCKIDQKFLYYFTISAVFKSQLGEATKQVAMPKLALKRILEFNIIFPPLAEQTRIVAKLDEAFAHLDTLKTSLSRIPELLNKFRQTVLNQALTGKLTEDWREDVGLPEWSSTKLSSVSKRITVGFVGKMSNEYKESGIPFLRSQNIRAFKYSSKNLLFVSEKFHEKIKKSALYPGDVAVVRSGYPGTTCVIPDDFPEANCSDILILTPKKEHLNSFYVSIFMNSDFGKSIVFQGKVGNAQQHFNTKTLQNTQIPLPSIEEQQEIVNRVEALFAKADAFNAQYLSLKAKIDKLPQALLAKAFRGELVPQDPNDEPASVLLEKIKAATTLKDGKKSQTGQTALAFMEE